MRANNCCPARYQSQARAALGGSKTEGTALRARPSKLNWANVRVNTVTHQSCASKVPVSNNENVHNTPMRMRHAAAKKPRSSSRLSKNAADPQSATRENRRSSARPPPQHPCVSTMFRAASGEKVWASRLRQWLRLDREAHSSCRKNAMHQHHNRRFAPCGRGASTRRAEAPALPKLHKERAPLCGVVLPCLVGI